MLDQVLAQNAIVFVFNMIYYRLEMTSDLATLSYNDRLWEA